MSREAAIAAGKYEIIGQAIDDKFIAHVKAQVVNQDAIDKMQKDIRIVYTPLHGTGNIPARRCLLYTSTKLGEILETMQHDMLEKARAHRDSRCV